ncbi:MAG: DUF2490 domain-containing protein [Kofleriaceae bacterium]|nr:DUF2490 domain-containing protein [Kofleriaceae bacterium]
MRAAVVAALLMTVAGSATAENQVWVSYVGQARIGEQSGPSLWLDLHERRRSDSTLFIVRPGIGYAFSPNLFMHVGFAWVPLDADDPAAATVNELRLWQQVIGNRTFNDAFKGQLRARFEERWGPGEEFGYRLRLLARGQLQPSQVFPLQLVVVNEVFVGFNDTDWAAKQGFDQNRLFVGLGVDTKIKGVRVEAGYMSVYLNGVDRFDSVAAINLTSNNVF